MKEVIATQKLALLTFSHIVRGLCVLWPEVSDWVADHFREIQAAVSAGYVPISDRQES